MRKSSLLVLIFGLVFMVTGCRLVDSGGSSDNYVAPLASVKVAVPVSIPAAAGSGSIRAQAAPGFVAQSDGRRLITGATVTIAGETLVESATNPGHYEGSIAREKIKLGFVVKAIAGRIKLVNIITSKEVGNNNSISVPADETTTTFAEVAKKAAGMADYDDLIEKNDEVDFDLDALKGLVEDDDTFKADRESFAEAIGKATEDDFAADLEEEGSIFVGVEIVVDDTKLPLRPDEEIVRARGQRFIDIVIAIETGQSLTAEQKEFVRNRLSENFMLNGTTRAMIHSELGLNTSLRANSDEPVFVNFVQEELQLKKLSDDAYLVGVKGVVNFTGGLSEEIDAQENGFVFNANFDTYTANSLDPEDMFPILIKKEADNGWMVYGNGIKIEDLDINLNYRTISGQTEFTSALWLQLDGGETEISSVKVAGGGIEGTIDLTAIDEDWFYMVDGFFSLYSPESWKNQRRTGEYVFDTAYTDGTSQKFTLEIPAHDDITTLTGIEVTTGEDAWTVTWPQSTISDFEKYMVAIEGSKYQDWEFFDKTLTSYDIPFEAARESLNAGINVTVITKRGIGSQYSIPVTVPTPSTDPTVEEQLQSMLAPLDGAFQGIAGAAGGAAGASAATAAGLSQGSGSMRASTGGITAPLLGTGAMFYESLPSEKIDPYFDTNGYDLSKLFDLTSVPQFAAVVPLSRLLIALYDGSDNRIPYPFTANPAELEVVAQVEHSFGDADEGTADVLFLMHSDKFALSNDIKVEFSWVHGKIDVAYEDYEFTIIAESGNYSDRYDTGVITSAQVKTSTGDDYTIEGLNVTFEDLHFSTSGLDSLIITVGEGAEAQHYQATRDAANNIVVTEQEPL